MLQSIELMELDDNFVHNQVKELVDGHGDGSISDVGERLARLAKSAAFEGLQQDDLYALIDLIIKPKSLSVSEKTFIIKSCLIPNRQYLIKSDIIFQILSQITIPQTYYKDGKRYRLKCLNQNLQLLLLQWLLGSIHLFKDGISTLNRCLSILMALLSFEYLRPYIANLIFIAIANHTNNYKTFYNKRINNMVNPFKNWHFQMILNLFIKFPLDPYLKSLLILFITLDPSLNLNQVENLLGSIENPRIFKFPSIPSIGFDSSTAKLSRSSDLELQFSSNLKSTLDTYQNFEKTISKKRRLNPTIFAPESITIDQINSIKQLIQNYNSIRPFTINTLFDSTSQHQTFRTYYILFKILTGDNSYLKKLDYMINFLLNSNEAIAFDDFLIDRRVFYGTANLEFSLIQNIVFSESPFHQDYDKYFADLYQKLKLLVLVNPVTFTEYDEKFFKPTIKSLKQRNLKTSNILKHQQLISIFIQNQLLLFRKWYKEIENHISQENIFIIFNTSIKELYIFLELLSDLPLRDILLLKILDFMKSISIDDLNKYFEDHSVMFSTYLSCTMFLNIDPFISSQICDYLVHCKNYSFKDQNLKTNYQNIVKDIINFVWLDNAFSGGDDYRKAFELYPNLVDRLTQLPSYNYSQVLTFKCTGSIFHNPTWSYLGAQIIWKMEDDNDNITVRHQGPITQNSVTNMNNQSDGMWLNMGFDDIKINVLKQLESIGFIGISNLLFSSLKSLTNKRDS